MTSRAKDYLLLVVCTALVLLLAWHYWPVLMAVETGQGLPH